MLGSSAAPLFVASCPTTDMQIRVSEDNAALDELVYESPFDVANRRSKELVVGKQFASP